MANIRVKDLPNTSAPAADTDEFIIDSSSAGTRRLNYGELKTAISGDFQSGTTTYKVATLGSDNKLDPDQIPDTLSQGLNFVGVANSAGDLTSTTQGDFYVIQTAFGVYSVGDQAVYDGSAYVRVTDGTKEISEGGTGATTLDAAKVNLEIANVGTDPSEVPLNQHLGDLAYQSAEAVSMGKAEVESITGTATTQALTVTDGTDTKFLVREDGRLGVNTASPAQDIHITGTDPAIRLQDTSAGGSAEIEALNGSLIVGSDIAGQVPNSIIAFKVDGAEAWRINSSGNLVANGTAIDFGSTTDGSGSGQAEILDDFETGQWSPQFYSSGGTLTATMDVRSARYVKVGHMVTVMCYIRTSNVDTSSASGSVRISGLPYAVAGSNNYTAVYVGHALNWATAPAGGYTESGASNIVINKRASIGGNLDPLAVSGLTNGSGTNNEIMLTATYCSF